MSTTTAARPVDLTATVRDRYAAVADSGTGGERADVRRVAEAFGYSADELDAVPAGSQMGLSCGNPTASASLRPGEVVVDLGCGGGIDVLLAAARVGPTGRAIGVDMTPAMIDRARANAAGVANAEFRLGEIHHLPVADASVDCVISNCVINLAADKPAVFRDVFRVLKPGGRVAVSDIALKRPLPPEIADDVAAFVGCIAGAIAIEEYRQGLTDAGFESVVVQDAGADLNAYASVEGQGACCPPAMDAIPVVAAPAKKSLTVAACCGPACCDDPAENTPPEATAAAGGATVHGGLADLLARHDVNAYAASVKVYALKPA